MEIDTTPGYRTLMSTKSPAFSSKPHKRARTKASETPREKRESDTPGRDRKDVVGVKPQKIEQLFSFFFPFLLFRKLQYRPFNYNFQARKKAALAYNRDYVPRSCMRRLKLFLMALADFFAPKLAVAIESLL